MNFNKSLWESVKLKAKELCKAYTPQIITFLYSFSLLRCSLVRMRIFFKEIKLNSLIIQSSMRSLDNNQLKLKQRAHKLSKLSPMNNNG